MNLSDWPTKEPAARELGISVKTLERMVDRGKIEQRMRSREGGTPVAVFNPADVKREAAKRAADASRPYVMPADAGAELAATGATLPAAPNAGAAAGFAELIGAAIAAAGKPTSAGEKVRVTMAEAIELGFTRDNLRELVKAGTLENVGTPHRYRFRRRDLDKL